MKPNLILLVCCLCFQCQSDKLFCITQNYKDVNPQFSLRVFHIVYLLFSCLLAISIYITGVAFVLLFCSRTTGWKATYLYWFVWASLMKNSTAEMSGLICTLPSALCICLSLLQDHAAFLACNLSHHTKKDDLIFFPWDNFGDDKFLGFPFQLKSSACQHM